MDDRKDDVCLQDERNITNESEDILTSKFGKLTMDCQLDKAVYVLWNVSHHQTVVTLSLRRRSAGEKGRFYGSLTPGITLR